MEDLDELILTQLSGINKDVGAFVTGILSDDLSKDDQIGLALRLCDLASAIRQRAVRTAGLVVEGSHANDGDDPPRGSP